MAQNKPSAIGYRFKDKDPAIDAFRAALERSGLSLAQVSTRSNVSLTTLYNWDYGKTKKPQHATLSAAMEACGYKEVWMNGEHSLTINYKHERGAPAFRIRKITP